MMGLPSGEMFCYDFGTAFVIKSAGDGQIHHLSAAGFLASKLTNADASSTSPAGQADRDRKSVV